MKNENVLSHTELPSMGKLIKSTILAALIAAIILVTVVLPAEYGIDPTGVGRVLGLQKMGEIKVSLAAEAASEDLPAETPVAGTMEETRSTEEVGSAATSSQSGSEVPGEEFTLALLPNEGKEIKLTMKKGEQVNFLWWTDGGRANFDAHADSEVLQIKYHNYEKGALERDEGVLTAEFDGHHGWFWRNRTADAMTVTLQVSGRYSDVVRYE